MGFVISIYSKAAFKEFILPSAKNADHVITLRSNYFQLKEDLKLQLEVLDGLWKLKKEKYYAIVKDNHRVESASLEDGASLTIHSVFQDAIHLFVRQVATSLHAFEKFSLYGVNEIRIGRSSANHICYDYQGMVSKSHAAIQRTQKGFRIVNSGQNGIYVNSSWISGSMDLSFGSYINILGLHMVYLGDVLAIDTNGANVTLDPRVLKPFELADDATVYLNGKSRNTISVSGVTYHRAPRNYEKLDEGTIEIEAPPEKEQEKKKSLFMSIGPSITMSLPMMLGAMLMIYSSSKMGRGSSLYMYSGLLMSVSSAVVGVTWTLLNMNQEKKERQEKEAYRFQTYSEYLVQKATEIKELYEDTVRRLHETYPDAASCLEYDESKGLLWNRNDTHDDFLTHRLGIGERGFPYEISVPKKKFTLYRDELSEKPAYIRENYQRLIDVPITIDLLENRLIGIVGGGNKNGAIDAAKLLAIQIAANNSYSDVKLAFIYDNEVSEDYGHWGFAKWLPHVWSEDKSVRYVAADHEDAAEVFYELSRIFRNRDENENRREKGVIKPYYVVFISNPSLLEGEGFAKYALSPKEKYGLTTVILTDRREYLPNECEYIIENSTEFTGEYNVYDGKRNRQKVVFDRFQDAKLDYFARHLSSLHIAEMEEGGEIPNAITFFEMFHINRIQEYPVREMWAKSKTYDNIKGLLGHRAGGSPCYLDVHEKYHGPHGLVAGTTGSGKSETLQTYILSLAINYSPDDIGFFIIDYKGGGMANLFDGLPHMVGSISNLSGNQVKRAMISIKSENRRRQRVFTEHGVNNINLYTKLYKNGEALLPIPHLFIIIDEFAELKREEPEFMKELISVAQVGRSLGVHLILATQKPSGTVDDNIWSNSKFRLCLRVQDTQDSKDMLHKPDAAYITQAGRGYLQVGNDEIYELFQSGFSGAVFDENTAAVTGEIAKMIGMPGKVDMTGNSVKLSGKKRAEELWIDSLCKTAANIFQSNVDAIKQLTDGESRMEFMVRSMYRYLAAQKVDYENSEYNTARLKDFLSLYFAVGKGRDGKSRAESIILMAGKTGKKLPQQKEKTQLDVTKEYLAEVAKQNGYNHKLSLWMPVLKEQIYLREFEEYTETCFQGGRWSARTEEWNLQIIIGEVDDPENQSQMPIFYDFSQQGHVAICGSIVSGKSTLMQTMIFGLIQKLSPDLVNIYALDFSSRMLSAFEGAPHVGGIMYESDLEKIAKFFNMLHKMVKERKDLFQGGNYKQYVQRNGVTLPAVVLFIDNYASFKEKTEQKYEDQLIQLSKEGVGLGIYLVVSGGGFGYNDITSRVGENMETIFCLALADKYAYGEMLHDMHIEVMPETGIKGRGLAYYGSRILEYQVALALEAENDYQRMEDIQKICDTMRKAWDGKKARRIPEIPKKPTWSAFTNLPDYAKLAASRELLPVAYDEADADIYSIPLKDIYCYMVMGGNRTGKTNFMQVMVQSALDKKADVCIIDSAKGDLKRYARNEALTYLSDEQAVFEYFRDTLTPVFQARNKVKNNLLAEDFDEMEIFEQMKGETPVFIFLPDLSGFVNMIYTSKLQMSGFMETLIAKGRFHHIYFVGEIATNKVSTVKGYKMYESFAEYKTGIHFGGKTNDNNVLPFEYLSYKEQSATDPVGTGTLPGVGSYAGTRKIVVPMAKK